MDTRTAGRMGGTARAANMTPEERSEACRVASNARWAKERRATATQGDTKRRAKAKARKVEKMRAASRKAKR